jgi:hypothetical protein
MSVALSLIQQTSKSSSSSSSNIMATMSFFIFTLWQQRSDFLHPALGTRSSVCHAVFISRYNASRSRRRQCVIVKNQGSTQRDAPNHGTYVQKHQRICRLYLELTSVHMYHRIGETCLLQLQATLVCIYQWTGEISCLHPHGSLVPIYQRSAAVPSELGQLYLRVQPD